METKTSVLEPIDKGISIVPESSVDPKKFFKTRDGLYVWSDFKERILDRAEEVKDIKYSVDSFTLTKNATDEQIEGSLPEKHLFSESDVCAIIADLISKQPKGEKGILLNTPYYANLFYTPAFVVRVRWDSGRDGWYVFTFPRGDLEWSSGDRVFSPAN